MKELFLKVYALYARFLYFMALLAGGATFIIMWLIDISAVTRKFLNWPVPGSVEISEALMVAGIMLPLAYAQLTRVHLRVPLVTSLLPIPAQRVLFVLAMFVGFLFFAAMAWSAYEFALRSYMLDEYVWGAKIRFPLYLLKATLFLGVFMIMLQFFLDMVKVLVFGIEEELEGEARTEAARGEQLRNE